jgi:peptidoglycan-associated lipoprotein
MNNIVKFGSVLSCIFFLAACETPYEDANTFDANADGSGYADGSGLPADGPGSESDFINNVGDRVYYATDSSVVTGEGRGTLERQAAWLAKYGNVNVVIEGHADERGTREYNLALGERRANAAKDVLVAAGVPESRITTITYGKERPAVLGSNPEAWAQNRRAVTVLAR